MIATFRRFRRPIIVYGGIVAATELVFVALDPGMTFGAVLAILAGSAAFCIVIIAIGSRAVSGFLIGLSEGELPYEVTEDEIGWWGDRRVNLQTAAGRLRVESSVGPTMHLQILGSSTFGWKTIPLSKARSAGRKMAEEATG